MSIEHGEGGVLQVVRHDDGELVRIEPGLEPARQPPAEVETQGGGLSYCCGPRGPMFVPSLVEPLERTFSRVEVGGPAGPWRLTTHACWMAFPPGFIAVTGGPDDEDPFFTLYPAGVDPNTAFIRFGRVRAAEGARVLEKPGGPDWRREDGGEIDGARGARRWTQFAYRHEATDWNQRRYLVPVIENTCALVIAQATAAQAASLFAGAELVATSFEPIA